MRKMVDRLVILLATSAGWKQVRLRSKHVIEGFVNLDMHPFGVKSGRRRPVGITGDLL
jgi:hypothetical protein